MSRHLVRIVAPPQIAFDYLAEPRNRPQWQSSLRAVQMLTTGPTRLGTRWVDRTTIGARPTLEITAMSPPSATPSVPGVWSEVGRWRGVTASLTLTMHPVAADPAATDVDVSLSLAGSGGWRALAGALRLLARTAVRADLHRAARIVEAHGTDVPRPLGSRSVGYRRLVGFARPRRFSMAAKAGEKAQKTGEFYCASCDEKVHVTEGDTIPECPNGHKTFEARRDEPGNKS